MPFETLKFTLVYICDSFSQHTYSAEEGGGSRRLPDSHWPSRVGLTQVNHRAPEATLLGCSRAAQEEG